MDEEEWEEGALVIDGQGTVFQRSYSGPGWWGLGLIDEEVPFDFPKRPLSRLVPLPADQRGYLTSLVRMDLRKRNRVLGRFCRRPEQTEQEAAEALERIRGKQEFCREVLRQLGQDPDHIAPKGGRT